MGKEREGELNNIGEKLIELFTENELTITNIKFKDCGCCEYR